MNFAIDTAEPVLPAKPIVEIDADQVADVILTRAMLGAEPIRQRTPRKVNNQVTVQVEQVFLTQSTVYVHYRIENNSRLLYRVNTPAASLLTAEDSHVALATLAHTQLDRNMVDELGDTHELALPIAHAEVEVNDLHPGEATQGVVPIRQDLKSPAIVQLVFSNGVKATFVL